MSKNKDIEKKLEKEIEKKLEKEFRKDKLEKPELKEKPEKREIKEFKEKPERKEFKEPIKEKVEIKEIKEIEKQVPEKGGKEIVEGGVDPGEIFQTRSANFSAEDLTAAAKQKETDKTIEKIKPEKENPEKLQKEIEKVKPEKENLEKVQKDIEKIKPEKEFSKHEIKEFKHEKIEHKELKIEKHEIKELKSEIIEKAQQKDLLPEKVVFENDPKGIVENPGGQIPGGDPATRGPVFKASGTAEDRLAELEDAVTKLTHFIGVDLRPDLSEGALKGEADVSSGKPADEVKPDAKKPR